MTLPLATANVAKFANIRLAWSLAEGNAPCQKERIFYCPLLLYFLGSNLSNI
jgi:hypothetical protein